MRRPKYPVDLDDKERKDLERISRKQAENASIVLRSKIILLAGAEDILPNGDFGAITHGLVIDFQARNGLVPNGIVDSNTKAALGLG